jgi:Icc-related predicted phosphoesterase
MKILAIGDPHGKLPRNLDKIFHRNEIELIVCTGDFGFTPKKPWIEKSWKGIKGTYVTKTYREVVDKICSYGLPVLTLRGNMMLTNKKPVADKILRKHKNLINKWTGKYSFNNQNFIFFDLSYEPSTIHKTVDKGAFYINRMKKNKTREIKLNKLLKENPNSILITHNPPYGYLDKAYTGKHVGSKILLNAIKKYKPKYVFCGHIHEAKGKAKIGNTFVYNLGWHGDYAIIDIEKDKMLGSNFLR